MENVVVKHNISTTQQRSMVGYLSHCLCINGSAKMRMNGQELSIQKDDSFIVTRSEMCEILCVSDDFEIVAVYVLAEFIELATPLSNYGMKGGLMLFQNPVMSLTGKQAQQLADSMKYIEECIAQKQHLFYRDLLLNAVQRMIIDFFDFHAAVYGNEDVTQPASILVNGFLELLGQGVFRQHREIGWYAERLNVSAKHLSETVKRNSGYPANHWINRYTALDLSRVIRRNDLTLTEIADMYNFASVSHLSRYVKNYLGVSPAELRK